MRGIGTLAACGFAIMVCGVIQADDIWDAMEISHLLHAENFEGDLSDWVVEQKPGGTAAIRDGQLEIDDKQGCTIWFKHKLDAPVLIQYEPTMIDADGPNDHVRDLNCFWMAKDPASPDDIFAHGESRGGDFNKYNPLRLYYVGYGGNHNRTTRFRRYTGTGDKPLLPEHDLRDPEYLLVPNRTMQIQIVVAGNRTLYYRNNEIVFDITDPDPYLDGWFGFRTVSNHMRIDNFRVYRLRERKPGRPAFPGAEGYGSTTSGGRGGTVMIVDKLDDYAPGDTPIPGSLRHALEQEEPRTITFAAGGILHLKAPLVIGSRTDPMKGEARSFVTLAGQSAPGGGVLLADQPLIIANTHDFVVRHLRFRNSPGDGISFTQHSRRVIIDHCSVSWASDENIGINGDHQDVTLSYILNGECRHGHSMGCVVTKGAHRVSVHHNFFTGNNARNAQFVGCGGYWSRVKKKRFGIPRPRFDFRNNLAYNGGSWTKVKDGAQVNIADNMYVRGPQSSSDYAVFFFNDMRGSAAWLSGNVCSWKDSETRQRDMAFVGKEYLTEEELARTTRDVNTCLLSEPLPTPPITCMPAEDLVEALPPVVGALPHDPTDARFVREFKTGQGDRGARSRKKKSPIPAPETGKPRPDRDHDGMPDIWEERHGLDPENPADAARDPDGDGYTHIEDFLNQPIH